MSYKQKDKTSEQNLKFWDEQKKEITINFQSGSNHTWNNETKLDYINKMIKRIKDEEV